MEKVFMKRLIKFVLFLLLLAFLGVSLFPTVAMVTASESRSLRLSETCEAVIFTTDLPRYFNLMGMTLPRNLDGDSMVLVHAFNSGLVKHEIEHGRQVCRMVNQENMNLLDMLLYYLENEDRLESEADSMRDKPLRHLPPTGWMD